MKVYMINPSGSEASTVVGVWLIQPHYEGNALCLEDRSIELRSPSTLQKTRRSRPSKANKLLRDHPVEVPVLQSTAKLIGVGVKRFVVKPAKLNGFLQSLSNLQDRELLSRICADISEWHHAKILEGSPGFFGRETPTNNEESASQACSICLCMGMRPAVVHNLPPPFLLGQNLLNNFTVAKRRAQAERTKVHVESLVNQQPVHREVMRLLVTWTNIRGNPSKLASKLYLILRRVVGGHVIISC
mmetsp:Transcript_82506/g.145615  ORF Transcript_82506/g.145615 Transcript_82506/m.145615 type:complete len:244 (+) Transcript_82506:939-1670(+)